MLPPCRPRCRTTTQIRLAFAFGDEALP
jgi:hypothetical protein